MQEAEHTYTIPHQLPGGRKNVLGGRQRPAAAAPPNLIEAQGAPPESVDRVGEGGGDQWMGSDERSSMADLYQVRFGDYFVAMNTTVKGTYRERTFTLDVPSGPSEALELVSGERLDLSEPHQLGPRSTVVLYFGPGGATGSRPGSPSVPHRQTSARRLPMGGHHGMDNRTGSDPGWRRCGAGRLLLYVRRARVASAKRPQSGSANARPTAGHHSSGGGRGHDRRHACHGCFGRVGGNQSGQASLFIFRPEMRSAWRTIRVRGTGGVVGTQPRSRIALVSQWLSESPALAWRTHQRGLTPLIPHGIETGYALQTRMLQ